MMSRSSKQWSDVMTTFIEMAVTDFVNGVEPEAVEPEDVKPEDVKPEAVKPEDVKPEDVDMKGDDEDLSEYTPEQYKEEYRAWVNNLPVGTSTERAYKKYSEDAFYFEYSHSA